VVGFEGERPFVLVVSNFQRIDGTRLSLIPASRRKWEATSTTGKHGAFATGSAEHIYLDELNALPKFTRTHLPNAVHRKLADLNRTAAQRAGTNGPISESCFTGQMSLGGAGTLVPHDVNPGGEYLPKFAKNLLTRSKGKGLPRLIAKMDADGNPLPRRLVQIAMKRQNAPFGAMMFVAEFQVTIDEPSAGTDGEK
jgi:hypothetical protein